MLGILGTSHAQGPGGGGCFITTIPAQEFGSSASTKTVTLPSNCSGVVATPSSSWITASVSGNTLTISVPAYAGAERQGNINFTYNGSTAGGVAVKQNVGVNPPPPNPCTISGFNGGTSFAGAGETRTYNLTYSSTCPSNIAYTFKQVNSSGQESDLPSWVVATQNITNKTVTIQFLQNSGTGSRNIIIIGKRQDGGTPGIGSTFTQTCIEKDWYLDTDGDGLRDPASTAVPDCASSKPGYTMTTTVDACPNIPNTPAENTIKTWYEDTDGDGYKDPNGQTVDQCTAPTTGTWTSNPQANDDLCPNYANSANGSNGCNTACLPFSVTPGTIEFSEGGGNDTATVNMGCTNGYVIALEAIPNNSDNWLSISLNDKTLTIVCQAGTTAKDVTVPIRVNGSSGGGIRIKRNAPPPPPPDPCVITGFDGGSSFAGGGETRTYNLNYSSTCPSSVTYTFKEVDSNGNESDLPSWVVATQNSANKTVTIQFQQNSGTGSRNIIIIGKRQDGGTPGIGSTFTQDCFEKNWYLDDDGDGFRNPGSVAVPDCANTKPGYTMGTIEDNCPNDPYAVAGSNGCPPPCTFELSSSDFEPGYDVIGLDENGGIASVTVGNYSAGCTTPRTISVSYTPSSASAWLQVTPSGNTLNVNCGATTEARTATVTVSVNGAPDTKQFVVGQSGPPPPPPPPATCKAIAPSNVNFDRFAATQQVDVTFVDPNICSGTTYLEHPFEATIPSWLTVTPNGVDSFILSVQENTSGTTFTTVLAVVKDDGTGTGNTVPVGASFTVTQRGCLTSGWYPDQDGDGSGDAYATPRFTCDPPEDRAYDYVDNNRDLCPDESGTPENQGCPNGFSPENRNTITTTAYDIDGTTKASSKAYFDEIGKLQQTQSWDVASDSIWASEVRYEEFGRPALQTLSAPIREGLVYQFKTDFIKKTNGDDYVLSDFDGTNLDDTTKENPNQVGEAVNTLGWYYSESNDHEEYQDATAYPFTKSIYSDLNPGGVLRSVGGNKVNGQWPQAYTFSMKAGQELSQTVAFGESKYNTIETLKTVSRDVHGVENVVFTDTDGKVLAAARSGSEGSPSTNMSVTIPEQGFVDVHIAQGISGFTVSNSSAVNVYDLISETEISGGTSGLGNGFFRVAVNDLETYVPESISVTYQVNYYDYSLNEYDEADRLITSYQPLGNTKTTKLKNIYEYNTLGQLLHTTSPDEGEAWFKYRDDGQIRFSQNSKQLDPNADGNPADAEFSYTHYDTYGRPVESGVYFGNAESFGSADSLLNDTVDDIMVDNDGLPNADCMEQVFTLYDSKEVSGMHAALTTANIPTMHYPTQKFVSGNVSKTYTVGPDASTTWYSYDAYGRLAFMVQDIAGIGAKTLDYEYDPVTGQVHKVYFQKHKISERFIHRYMYNAADELIKVETSTDDSIFELQAEYEYYETGAIKRTELAGGVQGIDYVYNLAGQLKSINHPDLTMGGLHGNDVNQDLFGMQIDYHSDDYKRNIAAMAPQNYGADQLNGNIKGVRWKNDAVPGATGELQYVYEYDRNNWLKSADFGGNGSTGDGLDDDLVSTDVTLAGNSRLLEANQSVTLQAGFHAQVGSEVTARIVPEAGGGSITPDDYDVSNITYDANGNIQSLKRNKQGTNNAMDDLSYSYTNGTNQLQQVVDADGDVSGADDIGSHTDANNYVYNAIGQLIENKEEGISYIYNAAGLVTEIHKDTKKYVTFFYNDRNYRIRKDAYLPDGFTVGQTTHYVRDVAGSIMAIYSNSVLAEQPIYGSGRLGVYYPQGTNPVTVYELTDHLGNVRAAFAKTSIGGADVRSASDYYPFGMKMPGRDLIGDYRFAFQGQEKDPETGKEAFELRLWDSRIGRWLTPDPYGQFASPYLGMGNNPINGIDPDGGCFTTDKDGNTIPCPDMEVGSTMTGAAGYEWTMGSDGWDRGDGYGVDVWGVSKTTQEYWKEINASAQILNQLKTLETGKTSEIRGMEAHAQELLNQHLRQWQPIQPQVVSLTIAEGPLAWLSGGGFINGVRYVNGGTKVLNGLTSTEKAAQGAKTIAFFVDKFNKGKNVQGIFTFTHKGKTYILDGHHRVQAALDTKSSLEILDLSRELALKKFPAKMEQILNGIF